MTACHLEPHATITRVEPAAALRWIAWARRTAPMPACDHSAAELRWLLAHCTDGVTWGRRDGDDGQWQLGSSVFGELCPPISLENLLELRLFGGRGELLLWRDEGEDQPAFRGRWLVDVPSEGRARDDDPCRPACEERILLGNQQLGSSGGFTRVGDGTGREQAVPLDGPAGDFGTREQPKMPLRFAVRHYFETDEETGAVRVAASRLVDVFNAASKGTS